MKNLLITSVIGAVFIAAIAGIKLWPMNGPAEAAQVVQNISAPSLSGKDWLNSKPISLESRRGKVTVVEFRDFTDNQTTALKLAQGVEVIGVHTPTLDGESDSKKIAASIQQQKIGLPILIDSDGANAKRWNLQYRPTFYLVDKLENIRYKWEGELNAEGAKQLSIQIGLLLKESGVAPSVKVPAKIEKITKTDAQWRALLSPEAYKVLRQEGTELACSSPLTENHGNGTFVCAGCGLPLFSSKTKFESGTGWPSFYQPIAANVVTEKSDTSFGMSRIAIDCARCGGHLGHVFNDGPRPTGLRYCMNGVAMNFIKAAK